jgi:hypothetical protein
VTKLALLLVPIVEGLDHDRFSSRIPPIQDNHDLAGLDAATGKKGVPANRELRRGARGNDLQLPHLCKKALENERASLACELARFGADFFYAFLGEPGLLA